MRLSVLLVSAVSAAGLLAAACGSGDESEFGNGNGGASSSGASGSSGSSGFSSSSSSSGGNVAASDVEVASLRVEPADAVIDLTAGQSATKDYKVIGKLKTGGGEVDLTSRAVFYVPDNYLVGGFPLDGKPNFTTRLPTQPTDPPQRGGKLTVEATLANSDGIVKVTTSLTVKLTAILSSPAAAPTPLPANPSALFGGAADAARNPLLAYPNDKTMLPPNLRRLDVHWRPGTQANTATSLYEIAFKSAAGTITYYSRCGGGAGFLAGACGFELDETGYGYLAETNRGQGPVTLTIRRTDDAGGGVGTSASSTVEFAEDRVDGGLYYWTVTSPLAIMRFDFGAISGSPEVFLNTNSPNVGTCPGCHTLSRDGKKMAASIGGQNDGRLIFVGDVSKTAADWFKVQPTTTEGQQNRIQFASFNPTGSQFVAVYGDTNTSDGTGLDKRKLYFHDGTSGLRTSNKQLAYKPNHPDWAPDGQKIAVMRVGNEGTTTQKPTRGSIELLTWNGNVLGDPVELVPQVNMKNRSNPNFVPDSSFLYYSESTCSGSWDDGSCDADADPSAKTWAVKPQPGAQPVLLAKAAGPGVVDGNTTNLGDTFPRSAPFQTKHRGGKLFWFTVASRRGIGLRTKTPDQLLWMFAVDPAKVLAGEDVSDPGFYLPFQNLGTNNHLAQWTEKIVGGSQNSAPPPPPPPPPPVPPVPR